MSEQSDRCETVMSIYVSTKRGKFYSALINEETGVHKEWRGLFKSLHKAQYYEKLGEQQYLETDNTQLS